MAYHLRSRHAPYAYARSLQYMDWESQPDPFRRYIHAPVVLLDPHPSPRDAAYDDIVDGEVPPPEAPDWDSISRLFFYSLALSAWKEAGEARWALRVNPSSGNLHPTEAYLVCGALRDIGDTPAMYHYSALIHGLERRAELPGETWRRIAADLPAGAFLVGFTSIPVRESWKYGERAFRYCQHDLGHAIASVSLAAAALGWAVRVLDSVPESAVSLLLGVSGQSGFEAELPEALLVVFPTNQPFPLAQWRHFRMPMLPELVCVGVASPLASEHHPWPVIGEVAEATRRLVPAPEFTDCPARDDTGVRRPSSLATLVRQRRSAVDMDGKTFMRREDFLRTMRRLLPGGIPFTAFPWAASVQPFVFVHRVEGLAPGLYALLRGSADPSSFDLQGEWERVLPDLPLYLIRRGDLRGLSQSVSCGQTIAGDGAFAVAMLCDLAGGLLRHGAPFYRRAHWEAGAIGQMLYLEAESDGLRGTGIGCFYDEDTHRAIGLPAASDWRTIYHFTVGGFVDDPRLRTVEPYGHLG
ncbi:hypothetical protein LBMAG42_40940 [Deltaproteobacteria bacterium]|nr:hypothetical protein LBMAG42_40940 [Deltaproteobacteria bacterium]